MGFVCVDTRYQLKNSNGLVENKDGNNKIYKFVNDNISLIIFNHGVNNINNKNWENFCSDYEKSLRWKNKNLYQIVSDFKLFIENDVRRELERNNLDNTTGFVLCGKTVYDNSFEVYELFWTPDFKLSFWKNGLIGSGDGYKKCLENYLNNNRQSNTVEFWKTKDTGEAKKELIKLFRIAVKVKKRLNNNEFSDNYNTECII